jgi:tRNA modification GTPase
MTAVAPDNIIALATAPGRGAIGVVRVSGRNLHWLVREVVAAAGSKGLAPRHATYGAFLGEHGKVIDRGLAIHFPAPHSYTGEDVLELQGHGGMVVMQMLVQRCLLVAQEQGRRLRLAEPGEFTRRAFLNDKMDLAQAEAVADLIEAQTEAAARSAASSLSGEFSKHVHALVAALVHLRMLVEATLDFPEEEIEFLQKADALGQLQRIESTLQQVLATARHGALLRDGLKVVLAGRPNAGKSSLLNALAGEEAAIVTPIAGTTRDKVERTIAVDGIPLVIVDTAGLRETSDTVEAIGVARTWQEVQGASVVIHLHDLAAPDATADAEISQRTRALVSENTPVLQVFNKTDVVGLVPHEQGNELWLSARTHDGLNLLRAALLRVAGVEAGHDSVFIARERHLVALREAQAHVDAARAQALDPAGDVTDAHLDLFAEELRLAQEALNRITGEFTADDLLGVIFSRFCIGK